ncbi:hypothetical protein [Flavisphingomonas formosensis]|uniref:hypothetical protein n=1 Tax=Flavisphingomonas formosensis TaxID=861534 RepID=UPI0012F8CD21|nr:hypothetical protein [Sphingomonas formosensis]
MTAAGGFGRSIGELTRGVLGGRRTFQPVRRNSYHAGTRESEVWQPIDPKEIGARMKAAEHFDRTNKEPGKKNGPLGHVALEVLRELYRLVDYKTGRLEPSIEYLEQRLARSRGAVVGALARLRSNGFLRWIRRTEPIEDADGVGPRVRQITNAYGFSLPEIARKFVRAVTRKAPAPDDDGHRRAEAGAEVNRMLSRLPAAEQAEAIAGGTSLGEALARLGKALDLNASSLLSQNPALEI